MITTVITCDIKGCKSRLELGDDLVAGAEELLQVTLADGSKKFFCCIEHLRQWANGYTCTIKAGETGGMN